MGERSAKWNIVLLGFVILVSGISIIIFSDKGDDQFTVINPIELILVIVSIFVAG